MIENVHLGISTVWDSFLFWKILSKLELLTGWKGKMTTKWGTKILGCNHGFVQIKLISLRQTATPPQVRKLS